MSDTQARARANRIPLDVQWLIENEGFSAERDEHDDITLRRDGAFVRRFPDEEMVHSFIAGMIFQRNGTCGSV